MDPALVKKYHDAMGPSVPGVSNQTAESIEKRKRFMESLTEDERAQFTGESRPKLPSKRSQLLMILMLGLTILLVMLVWFVTTCRNNSSHK